MSAMQGALSAAERSMRSVFVGNIPYEATEEQLKDIFAEVGPVVSFRLVYDRETGKPKGYGFCEYKDQEMALSAMRNLNGYELNGRALRVDNAASEKSKEELKNLQASLGGPPVESPYGPECAPEKAPEIISKIMCTLPPEQLNEFMIQMKMSYENNPIETRTLLIQNPQLAYALVQAQVIMRITAPEEAQQLLHGPGFQPPPIGALLPTPEKKNNAVPTTAVSHPMEIAPSYPSAVQPNPAGPMQQNPLMSSARPTQPVMPLTRPALLGERPPLIQERPTLLSSERPPLAAGPTNQMMQNPYPDRARFPHPTMPTGQQQSRWTSPDPRSLGDHDLRQMPMIDRDMRGAPMMVGDKDMRQGPGDQDLRTINAPGGMQPDNRSFDPRFRNMPGPGPQGAMQGNNVRSMAPGPDGRGMQGPNMRPMIGPDGRPIQQTNAPGFNRPHPGPNPYEARATSVTAGPRMENPHPTGMTDNSAVVRPPQNPRVAAIGGASPAFGGNSPNPNASPRPANLAAAAAAIAPHDQEKAALIMQVLQLSDQQIAMLPPEQRQSIMILKEQIARTQQT